MTDIDPHSLHVVRIQVPGFSAVATYKLGTAADALDLIQYAKDLSYPATYTQEPIYRDELADAYSMLGAYEYWAVHKK